MSLNLIYVRSLAVSIPLMLGLLAGNTAAGASLALQGQSKGDPTWIAGNLLNWQELDFIPCRVYITGGPASNQSVTISFPHLSGTTPGVQDLFNFAASPNAVITSGPTLTVAASGVWSYTFSVSVNNGNPAFVQFSARLAAGAHLNTGSSLMLGGNPTSMGNLQIHKPAPGPGAPNLGIVKSGPATTAPGATITYTLSYTNHATGTNTAYGSQISDILPDGLTVNSNGVPGGDIVGNTIFWDLGNLPPGAHGQVSFQAQVSASAANGQVLTNFSQIKSSEIDGSYADNISTFQTTVIISCTRPTVTQNPISQTSCPGTPISFSVAASGTGPFNYQWRHGGNNISAATNSTYSIGAVSAGDAGLYDVVVSNGCGSTNSGAATLSINTTVSATPLVSQTVCPGTMVVFSTVASGSGPFNYAWLKDGSPVGQNTNVLTLSNVTSANAGLYSVIVSGACGSVTNSATLAVNATVSATPLVSQTVCPGTTVVFSTVASGSGPFNYAWLKDGSPIGQNTNVLTLNNVTSANVGLYSVIVSGACGSVTNSATLAVNTTVSATPLVSQAVCPGTTVLFSTVASGSGPFNYTWLKDGSPLGQNTNTLTLNTVTSANAGLYSVIVSGACGSVTNSATLAVNTTVSATPLVSQTVCPGTTVVFSTVASGSGPFNYTWLKDGSPLGQNTNTLTLNTVTSANVGLYSVIVSGACGSVTNSATLAVNTTVSATPLVSQAVCPGTTVLFSTVASGSGPFNYTWLKDGSPLGQNTNTLTLNTVTSANAGLYSVIVSGACGSVTNSATLAVNTTVSATPLVSQTVCPGTTVVFSTVASGSGPFNYTWLKDGSPLGQNTNTLTLNTVTSANAGLYSVIVSGACGSVTNSATLAVNTTVSATPLVSQTVCPGTTVVFSTVASGSGPFNYTWLKDGSPVGQNTNVLTLNTVTSANAGLYSVIVSGACGSVTNSATLAVNATVSATPLVSQTVCPGTTVVFSTVASGSGPFNYTWFKDGSPVGQNTNVLTLNNATSTNAGLYSVIVSGACGSVTNSATLAVNATVSATPLVSQTVCPGTTVLFSTVASGSGPFNYTWLKDGSPVGQNTNVLTLNTVTSANAGLYSVIVSGACGSVTNSATLAVNATVSATPLVSQTVCPGTTVLFSTVASGSGPFNYAWFKDGSPVGQNTNVLTLNNATSTNAGLYSVIVSGACGSVTNSATLAVNATVSATPLVSQTVCPGTMVVFSTVASGSGPFNYTWLKDGSPVGQNTNVLTLNNATSANVGLYSVIVSGACGSVTNSATLAVNATVSATPLVSQTVCPGTTVVFSTVASGSGPFNYTWLKDGSPVGQNTNVLTLNNVTSANVGLYSVIVSGACGSVTNSATLAVNTTVSATPLSSLVLNPGETAVFSTIASGTGPFVYVWKKNGSPINGQIGSSLVLSNVTLADEATYTVEVSGGCGSASQSASLHINQAPTVNIFNPTNGTLLLAPANLVVSANAQDIDGVVTNVQFFQGTNKVGETTNGNPFEISLTNLAGGTYVFTAVATDNGGLSATSAPVTVTIMNELPLTVLTAVHFNPQTGLYEQSVRVTNPTLSMLDAIRVYVLGLTSSMHVYNPTGTTNGVPYVQSGSPVAPGGHADFVIEYYVTAPGVPNPTLVAQAVPADNGGGTAVSGAGVHINRGFRTVDGNFLVEFATETNRIYYVQYSSDLKTWKTVPTAVTGNGTWIQWVDNGQPKTESAPSSTVTRFYRVVVVSQ